MQSRNNFLVFALLLAIIVPMTSSFEVLFYSPLKRRSSLLMGTVKERPAPTKESLSIFSPSRAISRLFDDDDFFKPWAPLFDDAMHLSKHMRSAMQSSNELARMVRVGFVENEKDYRLSADLPGVKKEDLKVEVKDDRVLTISAERKGAKQLTRKAENGEEQATGTESFSSSYHRSMVLPDDAEVDPGKMQAELVDGVLSIEIPKIPKVEKAAPVPRFVTVK
jgi:HSP20 family protein